ncbi:MAG: hypothetical protein IIC99_08835 [Chloroflexi bacterium]|nr:hypothetical protein [Chloroflexota bacterium]
MPDWLFEVSDKDGNIVRLARSRWEMHIRVKHHEVSQYIEELKQLIAAPMVITRDSEGDLHLATMGAVGGKWTNLYLEAVVRYKENEGQVLTAHFIGRVPKGEIIWLKRT